MKKVYIIHGWGGSPNEAIHKWLKSQLEEKGFDVVVPEMPNPDYPIVGDWVGKLKEIIEPNEDVVLVGHSIGCQTILRYLEQLESGLRVGKVILLAPWFTLSNLEPEEQEIRKPWTDTDINEVEVMKHFSKMVTIFSNDDSVVPLEENMELFERKFNPEIIIENNKGHFTEEDGVTEVPSVLDAILN